MIKKLLLVILFFTATHSFSRNLTENHLPTELYGEWYNPENGDLVFGFYNNNAVYNEQVWRYSSIEKKGKDIFINIANDDYKKVTLKVKVKQTKASVSVEGGIPTTCTNRLSDCRIKHNIPEVTAPVFKEDTIHLSGYLIDYDGANKSIDIETNYLISNEQHKHIRGIVQPNGYFSISIPQTNPVVLLISTPWHPIFPYVEPGKHLFAIIGAGDKVVFGGNGAALAREDQFLRETNRIYLPYIETYKNDLKEATPEQYKRYLLAVQKKTERVLDSIYEAKSISPRIYQMHRLDIKYATYQYLLYYNYFMKRMNPQFKFVILPASYFDFLHEINDGELAPIAQAYPQYIDALNIEDNLNQLLAPFFQNKHLHDYVDSIGGKIEAVAIAYHSLHHKWEDVDEQKAMLLNTIYTEKNDGVRASFIANNKNTVDEILSKYRDIAMYYILIPRITNFICDSLGWKRGVATDLAISANVTRSLIKQNIKLPSGYFDLKDSIFADPFVALCMKKMNDAHVSSPPIQMHIPSFVNDWSYVSKDGIVSSDTIHKNGLTLIFINKYPGFADSTKNKMIDAFFKVYPKEMLLYNPQAPKQVTFVIDSEYTGVAASADSLTRYNPKWFEQNPNDIDVVTHEVMHIVQAYTGRHYDPSWVTEGIADYVRYTLGLCNTTAHWSLTPFNDKQSYTNAYRITARFFVWLEQKKRKGIVKELDAGMRNGTYSSSIWEQLTGKSVDELWKEYSFDPTIN